MLFLSSSIRKNTPLKSFLKPQQSPLTTFCWGWAEILSSIRNGPDPPEERWRRGSGHQYPLGSACRTLRHVSGFSDPSCKWSIYINPIQRADKVTLLAKVACYSDWGPEFNPRDPSDKRKPTLEICPLIFAHVLRHTCICTHIHMTIFSFPYVLSAINSIVHTYFLTESHYVVLVNLDLAM